MQSWKFPERSSEHCTILFVIINLRLYTSQLIFNLLETHLCAMAVTEITQQNGLNLLDNNKIILTGTSQIQHLPGDILHIVSLFFRILINHSHFPHVNLFQQELV